MPPTTGATRSKPTVKTVRLNINISENTARILRQLAEDRGTTVTDVVRLAVSLLELVDAEQKKGNEVQLVDPVREEAKALHLLG